MLLLGVVFTLSLWWGPGSRRLQEVVAGAAGRAARREVAGLVVVGLCVLVVLGLGVVLVGNGPTWAPAADAPWSSGFLASLARHL